MCRRQRSLQLFVKHTPSPTKFTRWCIIRRHIWKSVDMWNESIVTMRWYFDCFWYYFESSTGILTHVIFLLFSIFILSLFWLGQCKTISFLNQNISKSSGCFSAKIRYNTTSVWRFSDPLHNFLGHFDIALTFLKNSFHNSQHISLTHFATTEITCDFSTE